jgi:hypothetical protein
MSFSSDETQFVTQSEDKIVPVRIIKARGRGRGIEV